MKKIYNANNEFEANLLKGMLETAGVSCEIENKGYIRGNRISLGTCAGGVDIYVREEDEKVANDVLNQYLQDMKNNDTSDDLQIPWYKNRIIVPRIGLGIFVLAWIVVYICVKIFA